MNFLRKPKDWPYAADSVGVPNGTLKIQRRHIPCYTIVGSALVESEKLKEEIIDHIQRKITELQEPEKYINVSAYMIGKHPRKTSPIVMILSDDNELRKTAFKSVQESCIMEKYPGFALGHRPLRDEFRDLRALGDSYDESCTTGSFSTSDTTLEHGQVLHGGFSESVGFPEDHSLAELRPSTVYINRKGPQTPLRLFYETGVNSEVRAATAGGLLHCDGRYMFHTVQHFLEPTKQNCNYDTFEEEEQDNDCEVFGWDDSEDDADDFVDLAEITSRGSVSPSAELYDDEQSDTDVESISVLSSVLDARDPALLQSRLEAHVAPPPDSSNLQSMESGNVILSSRELDLSLVEIDLETLQRLGIDPAAAAKIAISLDDFEDCIELCPPDKVAVTVATQGHRPISGILSGQSLAFCLPGSRKFVNVYSAKLDQPLLPGDCGSWVRSGVSGKVFGHIIAGSPSTGLVLIMPASRALIHASDAFGISIDRPRNNDPRQIGVHTRNSEEADMLSLSVFHQAPYLQRVFAYQLSDDPQLTQEIRELSLSHNAAPLLRLSSRTFDRRHPTPSKPHMWLDFQAQRAMLKLIDADPYHEETLIRMVHFLFSEVQESYLQSSMRKGWLPSSSGHHAPQPHRTLPCRTTSFLPDALSRIFANFLRVSERNISSAPLRMIQDDLYSTNDISTVCHDLIESVDGAKFLSDHGQMSRWGTCFKAKNRHQDAQLFSVWATDNFGGNSFWIRGVPGSGKSTLLRACLDQHYQVMSRSLHSFTEVAFERFFISPRDFVFRDLVRSIWGSDPSEASSEGQLIELLLARGKLQAHGDNSDLTWHRKMLGLTDPVLRSTASLQVIYAGGVRVNAFRIAHVQHLAEDIIYEADTKLVSDLLSDIFFSWKSRKEVFNWLPTNGLQPDTRSLGERKNTYKKT
ncbi:hypothetical protein CcaCcLH18_02382 [Colletotrichum camelliae]|nr:hypothetical protein CcaCcLH18_02382 [Colletotrichum camelliae]